MTEPEEDVQLSDRARAILSAARQADPPPAALAALRRKVVSTPPGGGPGGASVAAGAALVALAIGAALFFWPAAAPPAAPAPPAPVPAAVEPSAFAPPPAVVNEELPLAAGSDPSPVAARTIDEASYLESIRRALERQPTRAVRLARRHPVLYPEGLLSEEAAALEAEGLARSGDPEAARTRADALYARFPSTPYRRRIERAIEGAGATEESPPAE